MNYFQQRTRDNGETFYCLADHAPEWVLDAVREAHDGESPDDWRYETCADIFEMYSEYGDEEWIAEDVAEGLADTYTADLLTWYANNVGRCAYVDDFSDGVSLSNAGLSSVLRMGQQMAISNMAETIRMSIVENLEAAAQ